MSDFSHFDDEGRPVMVDVTDKAATTRTATAKGTVVMAPATLKMITDGKAKKGDVLAIARLAGIMAAKRTPDLIPLCHPIAVHGVDVDLEVEDAGVRITVAVRTADRTGVEMEALTGASVGALALIDMVKGVDRSAMIDRVVLLEKSGGRSGHYVRPEGS